MPSHEGDPEPSKLTGISTEVWGPKAWSFLHAISFRYPERAQVADREAAYRLLRALEVLLPCPRCRGHMRDYLNGKDGLVSSQSPHLDGRASFSKWLVEFHNGVNSRLGKTRVEYEHVEPLYRGDYVCPPEPPPRQSLLADLCADQVVVETAAAPSREAEKNATAAAPWIHFPASVLRACPGGVGVGAAMAVCVLLLAVVIGVLVGQQHSYRRFTRRLCA